MLFLKHTPISIMASYSCGANNNVRFSQSVIFTDPVLSKAYIFTQILYETKSEYKLILLYNWNRLIAVILPL